MTKLVFLQTFPLFFACVWFLHCGNTDPGVAGTDAAFDGTEIGTDNTIDADDVTSPITTEPDAVGTIDVTRAPLDTIDEKPVQCEMLAEECTEGTTWLVADMPDGVSVVTSAMSGTRGLVAWAAAGALHTQLVENDGTPKGDPLLIHDATPPISNVEVLAGLDGFIVLFSRGTVDTVTSPDEIIDYYARVNLDGVLVVPTQILTTGVQLMRGAAISETGLRMWGIRDAPSQDTGEVFRQASMIRATPEGVFQETHYMLNASKFAYMRLHASGNQLNVPFVDPSPQQAVSYLLQNVNLPGCGVPVQPVIELGPKGKMTASTFLSPLVALWAIRDETTPGNITGKISVHNTAFSTTESLSLPSAPSDLADLSAHEQGVVLFADFDGANLITTALDPYTPCIRAPTILDTLPQNTTPGMIRLTPSGGGFFVVWTTWDGSVSRIWGRQSCPIR
ncbi:MAG: hypothetical protein HUU55_03040 [Myxococcales bacterium]|nr:hypothetical protein [Myxococcales bacterium]